MPAVGLALLLTGAFLISSAVVGRNPVDTLVDIIRDPSSARDILEKRKGSVPLTGKTLKTTDSPPVDQLAGIITTPFLSTDALKDGQVWNA